MVQVPTIVRPFLGIHWWSLRVDTRWRRSSMGANSTLSLNLEVLLSGEMLTLEFANNKKKKMHTTGFWTPSRIGPNWSVQFLNGSKTRWTGSQFHKLEIGHSGLVSDSKWESTHLGKTKEIRRIRERKWQKFQYDTIYLQDTKQYVVIHELQRGNPYMTQYCMLNFICRHELTHFHRQAFIWHVN